MTALADDTAALTTQVAGFASAKIPATAHLTAMAAKATAGGAITIDDLNTLIGLFNAMTVQSNALRVSVAAVQTGVSALTIGIANLTDSQVETIQQNPQQYVCGGYICIVNGILAMNADQPTMLSLAAGIGNDLATDINNAWADLNSGVTPAVPRPSVAFDNGNALEIVIAGLQAASAAAPS